MATKGIGRPLTILLQGDTSGLGKALQEAQTGLGKFSKQVDKAAKVAAVAFAGVAAAGFDAARAAAEDEVSASKLATTLKNVTGATAAQVKATEDYITKTSLAVGIADDELRPAFARLVRSTDSAEQAQGLLNKALDISAATGKPVSVVAEALGKAYDGNTKALGKLGLGIDAATLKSGDLGAIMEEVDKKTKGAAQTNANTAQGSFNRMTVAINEAKESIGYGLLPYVTQLASGLQTIAPLIANNADLILKLSAAVAGTSATILGLKFAIDALEIAMKVAAFTSAALKIAYLTVAAAAGSASAAQQLAYLTYVKSTAAAIGYRVAMLAQAAASGVATAAQYALNLAMSLNPVGALVIGIAALGAAMVIAYKKVEPFRDLVDSLWEKIKGIVKTISESKLGQAVGKLLGVEARATGGPVRQGRTYLVGENGPELFTATGSSGSISPAGSFGSGQVVNITINGAVDAEGTRRQLEQLFQRSSRRTGAINLQGATL